MATKMTMANYYLLSMSIEVIGDAIVIFETGKGGGASTEDVCRFVDAFQKSRGLSASTRVFYRDQTKRFCRLRGLGRAVPEIENTGTTILEEALRVH